MPDDSGFSDSAVRDGNSLRAGLGVFRSVIEFVRVGAAFIFSPNRLFWNTNTSLVFVTEEILSRKLRCMIVRRGINTQDVDRPVALISPQATCPKSWRHTFATQLQDANVDPLIRQLTLGHKPTDDARSALGMTACYSHSRMVTRKREIERALRLWPGALEFASHWAVRGV